MIAYILFFAEPVIGTLYILLGIITEFNYVILFVLEAIFYTLVIIQSYKAH